MSSTLHPPPPPLIPTTPPADSNKEPQIQERKCFGAARHIEVDGALTAPPHPHPHHGFGAVRSRWRLDANSWVLYTAAM